ncbi:MAG: hypothetical protein Q7S92_03660, partial [Candidatus Diapherotrites archaeon]|nr:hypothetical protein [Candidatus Diapherotrites archaeon]
MTLGFVSSNTWHFFKKSFLFSIGLTAVLLAVQYFSALQSPILAPIAFNVGLVQGFAFSGMILIALALLAGPVIRLNSKWNWIGYRRYFGFLGFLNILFHIFFAISKYFNFDLTQVFFSTN